MDITSGHQLWAPVAEDRFGAMKRLVRKAGILRFSKGLGSGWLGNLDSQPVSRHFPWHSETSSVPRPCPPMDITSGARIRARRQVQLSSVRRTLRTGSIGRDGDWEMISPPRRAGARCTAKSDMVGRPQEDSATRRTMRSTGHFAIPYATVGEPATCHGTDVFRAINGRQIATSGRSALRSGSSRCGGEGGLSASIARKAAFPASRSARPPGH